MILKSYKKYKLCAALFFISTVLMCSYKSGVNNGEHHTFHAYKPSKERHTSSSDSIRETKQFSDKNDRNKQLKFEAKVQTGKIKTSRFGNSKTEADSCTKKKVILSQAKMPIIGLVSFPGSGNTWTRHLIQQMTGLGTSSVYCDRRLKVGGFPYECHHDKTKTVVVKTHTTLQFKMFSKIVLLIRNPYDAFLSFANFIKAGHTGNLPEKKLIKVSNMMFEHCLRWYVDLTRNTTQFMGPVHVIQYELLQTNMSRELKKLATFFDLNISDRDIKCTLQLQEGNFHRFTNKTKHVELLRAVFSKEKLLRLQDAARYSEKMIKNAYNIQMDLSGQIDKILFQDF